MLPPMAIAAEYARPAERGGMGDDHILAAKRYDRGRAIYSPTIIPCRDPTSGLGHAFDLVIPRRCSSDRLTGEVKDKKFS
jgi:hypothetical protein